MVESESAAEALAIKKLVIYQIAGEGGSPGSGAQGEATFSETQDSELLLELGSDTGTCCLRGRRTLS